MKFLNYCGRICVMFDMLVLMRIFGTSTTHISSGHSGSFLTTVGVFV